MAKFELVNNAPAGARLPERATGNSAGYDFFVAEDTLIPSFLGYVSKMKSYTEGDTYHPYTLDDMAIMTKKLGAKPTLVPTGVKCKLDSDEDLLLFNRSSSPLKYWLIVGNGVGLIDSDYYGNESNDGHIYVQLINLSPVDIIVHKGEKIAQGVIKKYIATEDDTANGIRKGGFGSTN